MLGSLNHSGPFIWDIWDSCLFVTVLDDVNGAGDLTQALTHARHVLSHLNYLLVPVNHLK